MSKYQRCKDEGHEFETMDEDFSFDDYTATLVCKKCDATVDVQGDIRADDGRHIEWVLDDEPDEELEKVVEDFVNDNAR